MAGIEQGDPNGIATLALAPQVQLLNEFWNEDALAAAEPIGLEIAPEAAMQLLAEAEAEWQAAGPETTGDPVVPGGAAAELRDPQPPCPAAGCTTERVPNRTVIPYCAVGKLFMTFDGSRYVGSAWTIGESTVFTAGHCLYDNQGGAGWADNILFIPQYHNGAAPLGRWAAIEMATLNGWIAGGNDRFKYDLAAFRVDRPIRPATGSLGWLANAAPNQGCITGIGYPAAAPFNGEEMWRSSGHYVGGSNPIQMRNDMTGGCSGGPWEIWRDGTPLTNGLNSFRYTNDPATMYSPYFGTGFLNLANW
ncbi:MAG: hypothetical protein V4574_12295 [Pseudomonadota bacterium]